jgi:membrane protease YdiL (CAAX protease family)
VRWLHQAAENGDSIAQSWFGLDYLIGKRVDRDPVEAARWLRLAAEGGDAVGQAFYALCLFYGEGASANKAEAVEWFRKSADQGNARSQYKLGLCYARGDGVAKDFGVARKWLRLAADQNYKDASYQLRALFVAEHPILRRRFAFVAIIGYAFLAYHATQVPFSVSADAISRFLLIFAIMVGLALGLLYVLDKRRSKRTDDVESQMIGTRVWSNLKNAPWKLLSIPAEDGFCLLPLLYIGINPFSAIVAAVVFAVLHYPSFPWRYCVPKGVAYFFIALFVLPYGIWSVIAAHLLLDATVIVLFALSRVEGKPALRRLLRVMQSK